MATREKPPASSRLTRHTSFSFLSSVPAHAIPRGWRCCRTKGLYDPFQRNNGGVFNFREWLSIVLEDSSYGRAWDVAQVMNDMERDLRLLRTACDTVTSRTSPPGGLACSYRAL